MRSHSGTVYAGTEFTLISDISFGDVSGVDTDLLLDIMWTRGSDVIASDIRTVASGVSDSGTGYTASLSFSPIANSDSGFYTATVTVRPTTTSQYIQHASTISTESVTVKDLPAPNVTISNVTSGTAGEQLVLTCTVTVVESLIVTPTVQWSGGSVGRSTSVTESETTHSGDTSSRALTFSPLNTSHGAEYTCQAEISIPSISVTKAANESKSLSAQIPNPTLTLSIPSGPLYEGTTHTLTCTVTLPDTVDTDVNVTVQWTPDTASDRVRISPVSSTRSPFVSTLTLSPLSMTDAGQYSCVAIADSASQYITASSQRYSSAETLTVTALPESSITTTIAIIGGVVAIVIALVIAITIVTIVALMSRICRGESSLKKAERVELTSLPSPTVVEGVAINTSSNAAYEMMKQGGEAEEGCELITRSPRGAPTANQDGVYEVPSPPPGRDPLPAIPPPVAAAGEEEEEGVYEIIPGDK